MLRTARNALGLVSALDSRTNVKRHLVQTAEHLRAADCIETDCPHYNLGWTTTVDEKTDLGLRQARYIRKEANRKFKEHRNEVGLTVFLFEQGQKCFRQHKIQTGEAPIKLVTRPDGSRTRQEADRWFYEANEEVYQHEERKKRGGY